ncbi:MAG: helix-turn-helix transcriptional regulator, partial [Lentisphaeria bacterium]|nr:helix-turn-helix transcriptional regulator [Lentisphaeria bacterium]
LALHAGISESTLRRQVKKYFSCSPMSLVNNMRLEQAAMLLKNSHMAVKEIAIACGFRSPLYFGTVFKAAFGMPPGEYRREISTLTKVQVKYLKKDI